MMTYTEAKKEIDSRIELANRHYRDQILVYIKAIEMASEAIKRQVPKKPYNDYLDGKCCPTCLEATTFQTWQFGLPTNTKMRFCQNCGQAIDWSEE